MTALNITSPKRDRAGQSGWEGFFPYYAGFPSRFALQVIDSAGLAPRSSVLDPWNGSGTTTHAASLLGHTAIGFDVNPVMVVIARARMLAPTEADSLVPLCKEIIRGARVRTVPVNEPLTSWFVERTASYLRAIENSIQRHLVGSKTQPSLAYLSSMAAMFYSALFSVCRDFATAFKCSNPTWTRLPRAGDRRVAREPQIIAAKFLEKVESMSSALGNEVVKGVPETVLAACRVGDSTQLSLQDGSIDLILGSPPYCTRLDYTAATRIELAVMAGLVAVDFKELGQRMIGSTRVPILVPEPNEDWGQTCLVFLDQVAKHKSKASSGYYLKTHLDYYDKMYRSLNVASSALRPKAKAVLVVQDSYYKDIHNPLTDVIIEMAQKLGLTLTERHDFSVRRSMGSVNSGSRTYRENRLPVESVLCMEKNK